MPTTTPENASDLYKRQITDIAVPSPANKAAAVLLTPINGKQIFVNGSDGGWFTGVTGLPLSTLVDDGGAFCGTVFIPTGGDGSAGWERENLYRINLEAYGASKSASGAVNVLAIQQAFDNVPLGCDLVFNEAYPLTGTADYLLTLSRNVNLVSNGIRRANLRADSVGANTSVLEINMTDNGGFGDVRNWKMEGITIFFNGGGKHSIDITGGFVLSTSNIHNCSLGKGDHADASAFNVQSAKWAHSLMDLCTLSGSVLGSFGDANVFTKNLCFGLHTAFIFDLVSGIRNNTIENNTIVTRDGALHIVDGQEIRFINNQVEQFQADGANQLSVSASVYIEGATRTSKGHVIEDNNFGGGTNVDRSIYADDAQHVSIGKNHFVAAATEDVLCTANSKFIIDELNNTVTGSISDPRTDPLFKLLVTNQSGYNINMPLGFTGQNGWSSPAKAYYKAKDGRVIFIKTISGGTSTGGTVCGSLAPGCWPTQTLFDYAAMDVGGTLGSVTIPGTNGVIIIRSIASNGGMFIQPIQSQTDSLDF